MLQKLTSTLFFALLTFAVAGQDFLEGSFTFSKKKESYITLADGKEMVGFIDDIDRKKGLIEEITIKDKNNKGKKVKLKPAKVKHMYIAPSGFDKMGSALDLSNNITKWNDDHSAHATYIKEGYVFFETTDVIVKKKKQTLLLQLLNPGFSDGIKVYFDPYAKEAMGASIGGVTVAGGGAKSYYFKKGNATAVKLEKKNYDEEAPKLYQGCAEITKEYGKDLNWSKVAKHVFLFSENCGK